MRLPILFGFVISLLLSFAAAFGWLTEAAVAQVKAIKQPETLEEVRRFDLLKARLREIERYDGLILTGFAATHAIERCDETGFKQLRKRIETVILDTENADQRLASLDKRRQADVEHQKNEQKRVSLYCLSQIKALIATSKGRLKRVAREMYNEAGRGSPDPVSTTLRAIYGGLKQAEKDTTGQYKRNKRFEYATAELRRSELWVEELKSPELIASIAELHRRHEDMIAIAKRVLNTMDGAFEEHSCKKCVQPGAKPKKYPKWLAQLIARHRKKGVCSSEFLSVGKVTIEYSDGRKVSHIITRPVPQHFKTLFDDPPIDLLQPGD